MFRGPRAGHRLVHGFGMMLVAVLVSASLTPSVSAVADDLPRGTTLRPGQIERGEDTRKLHLEGRVIVDGDRRTRVEQGRFVNLLGRVGDEYLVRTIPSDYRSWRLLRIDRDGNAVELMDGGRNIPLAIASDDGSHVALIRFGQDRSRLTVADSWDGAVLRDRRFLGHLEVMDYGPRRLVLTQWPGPRSRTFWWNPHNNRQVRISNRPALLADVSADRVSLFLGHVSDCLRVAPLSEPRRRLWRSCRDRVIAFSPDGRRMITGLQGDDHFPPVVQVRRIHGRLQATYRAKAIGFAVWENNRSVLIEAMGRSYTAVVRCTPRQQCERATRLHKNPGHPQGLDWGFPEYRT